ncbi:MAG: zinc metallopeptidase [Gammaproteobacteria bacterium]
MIPALILILILIAVFAPQFWVQYVLRKYSEDIDAMPGTGGELARHLTEKFNLAGVDVEAIEYNNDHYDPEARKIRLAEDNYHGKSLTAITIAAHEFGHALQHAENYQPLALRSNLARFAAVAQKIASVLLVSLPFTVILVRVPLFNLIILLSGLTIMLLPVILHLVTLPVELDASFNRALPILEKGNYLPPSAMPIARKILTAAALTYVAASLASLLNFYRWIAILRR